MYKGYCYRIYPNKEQKEMIEKTFGCCRFVYNYFLDMKIKQYKETGTSDGYIECCSKLTKLKEDFCWLKEVDSDALQKEIKNLINAYKMFYNKNANFPKFKNKKTDRQTYTATQNRTMKIENKKIRIPKLQWVKANIHQELNGRILNITVFKDKCEKYYANICCEIDEIPNKIKCENQVGIDLGIKNLAILSNGEIFKNKKYFKITEDKIAKEQRKLSKMIYGSNNYKKQKLIVNKLYCHMKNQRKNDYHIFTKYLTNKFSLICIEDLDIKKMTSNKNLAKSIHSCAWGIFISQLEYKGLWNNCVVQKVGRFYPSSQICSSCGKKDKKKGLSIREWICPSCGEKLDRDLNASINILNEGKRILGTQ